jgi:hypothetical protein
MNALVNSIPSITATNHTDTQAMSNNLWIQHQTVAANLETTSVSRLHGKSAIYFRHYMEKCRK